MMHCCGAWDPSVAQLVPPVAAQLPVCPSEVSVGSVRCIWCVWRVRCVRVVSCVILCLVCAVCLEPKMPVSSPARPLTFTDISSYHDNTNCEKKQTYSDVPCAKYRPICPSGVSSVSAVHKANTMVAQLPVLASPSLPTLLSSRCVGFSPILGF